MPRGGDRVPSNPAPVSGPGAMSKRTDGQAQRYVAGLPYGDGQELMTQQGAAPMAGQTVGTGDGAPQVPLAQMSPNLFDKTNAPGEPVTAGANFGPGPDQSALSGGQVPNGPTRERIMASLPILLRMSESPDVSREFRQLVSYIRSVSG